MKNHYEVVCGNVGSVYSGSNLRAAKSMFRGYVTQSKTSGFRASGENVTLMGNGEPIKEFFHPYQDMRAEIESGECALIDDMGNVTLCGAFVARISDDCTQAQALRALREEMAAQGFWPNCYRVNERGNTDCVSVRTGKAYKGRSYV